MESTRVRLPDVCRVVAVVVVSIDRIFSSGG